VWATTSDAGPETDHVRPAFGQARAVFNVIDSRQAYLQALLKQALATIGFAGEAAHSTHFSYEMVALSHATARALGYTVAEGDDRPFVEVSGRKGLGVKADDLIDKLIEKALEEVASRHAEEPEEKNRRAATQIAVGALRYFMLKYTRNSVIAFDFAEALAFVGETGVYVQYAVVRARKILQKLAERGESLPDFAVVLPKDAIARQLADESCWQYLLDASKMESAIERAVASGEPAHVARYAFQLAQAFSNFYDKFHVLDEADAEARTFRLWMTEYFRSQLERTRAILGIEVPDYM
jgi:arginyl-tRNA synthetase